ncbi:hypothetical protein [Rhodococcus sp. IEGM 1379]|uniref:hypothetical protein n=1 Tax=Rhodococcus sp. IEGM 1379 TaxID=3047086 RepID=UPI0024B70697|nr:hypothetical protein [Rhodococcus sp. IEGM 1379]MDI9917219.1 hypothetical protein [Rhodococcus sp. IEGM 1379]
MYAPHNNPEMQERREDCGHGHERRGRREHGPRGGWGFAEGRPERGAGREFEGGPEGRRGRPDRRGSDRPGPGRRGQGRPEFTEAAAKLRPEMGLLRGAVIAVGTGGTVEQVAKAEAVLAEARRALFELLAEKPAETDPAETPTETSTDTTVK